MNQIEKLAENYARHVGAPWPATLAGAQRVMMVVYAKERERALRAHLGKFEQATREAGHGWTRVDATRWFAEWMASHDYRDAYFETPELLDGVLRSEFRAFAIDRLTEALESAGSEDVVALIGAGSLYGFTRVSNLVRSVEQRISGRLAVFFPGAMTDNNYRLLDARDGGSYLAQPIILHEEWIP